LELLGAESVAFVCDHFGRKGFLGPLFLFGCCIPDKVLLVLQSHRLLFIESRTTEWINSQSIDGQMTSDGRCRQLRQGDHAHLIFETRFEGVERLLRKANNSPVATYKQFGETSLL